MHTLPPADVPATLYTTRLLLRAWTPDDAPMLAPVLEANVERLSSWIPARVATPAPVDVLAERLSGYAADFFAGRAFRFALYSRPADDAGALLGGADLHPRSPAGRAPLAEADRVEVGYWLAASAEGHGFAVEAVDALLGVARSIPRLRHAEARVDPRNARSANVARRLGFQYSSEENGLDVWTLPLLAARAP